MIPLVSLTDLINGIISAAIAIRLTFVYLKNRNQAAKHFIAFYCAFAAAWLFWATPELVISDPQLVMATNILGYLGFFITSAIMIQLPFIFFPERRQWGLFLSTLIVTAAIIFLLGRLLNLQEHIREINGPYVYWKPVMAPWLRVLMGVSGALGGIVSAATFLYLGLKDKNNPLIFKRSLYLCAGLTVILLASIFSFILFSGADFVGNAVGSVMVICGLLLMLRGIVYEERRHLANMPAPPTSSITAA